MRLGPLRTAKACDVLNPTRWSRRRLPATIAFLKNDILRRSSIPDAAKSRSSIMVARNLLAYSWPHNIRELQGVLDVAIGLADNGFVERLDLPNTILTTPSR